MSCRIPLHPGSEYNEFFFTVATSLIGLAGKKLGRKKCNELPCYPCALLDHGDYDLIQQSDWYCRPGLVPDCFVDCRLDFASSDFTAYMYCHRRAHLFLTFRKELPLCKKRQLRNSINEFKSSLCYNTIQFF